ncbi:MAG: hypothetical protein DRQ02_11260 [Candidatus Latescibacterota bacterium]|nr:MAG: hypothetical protein DRQ02_11260 [Candidatus Latescibacterota bacterium]RKY68780.1 MAG: hypothetical protein DRQ24_11385 [Candidatus Latescibacterota bacterium]
MTQRNDTQVKEMVYKLFWILGYIPFYEVNLYSSIGLSLRRQQITDIDVLGVKLTNQLTIEKVLAECKGGKQASRQPVGKSLWLKGVMDYFGAHMGMVVLDKTIPEEHRLAAFALNVRLFSKEELEKFMKVYNLEMFENVDFYQYTTFKNFTQKVFSSNSNLLNLKDVLFHKFWTWPDEMKLRFTLGEIKKASKYLNANSKFHTVLLLETFVIISIALQIMLSYFYPIYLSPESKEYLSDRLKFYLYGGKETYDYLNSLYEEILKLKSRGTLFNLNSLTNKKHNLSLPYWEEFIQLFKNFLENPLASVFLPHLFRILGLEKVLVDKHNDINCKAILPIDNLMLKMASDVVDYVYCVVKFPEKMYKLIRDTLYEFLS